MSVYLQFDSSARTDAYINRGTISPPAPNWVPNDNYPNDPSPAPPAPYQQNKDLVQSPSNYRVFYRELNDANNIRTIGFLAHCREHPYNLNFSVESCVLTVPSSALVPRVDNDGNVTYVSILNEPYLYVRMMPINHAEGNLIYSNNPPADDATFIFWIDKNEVGNTSSPTVTDIPRPNPEVLLADFDTSRWVIYKSCMITVMRLDLEAQEWQIRIYDRFGNDIILAESDNGGVGFSTDEPPAVDPNLQTMLLVGIKPNYPL